MATILARSRWTSTAPKGSPFNWSRVRGIVCHYPAMGKSVGVLSEAQETARLRGWRNYHVGSLGWSDIGYNYAIGQSGRIYSLRGDRVGGHAVGHNSTTVGVLFIVGDNEPLTRAAQASFRALRTTLRQRGAGSGVWGHTEMSGNSTRCPGPYIMADIRSGVLKSASAGVTIPVGGGGASTPKPSSPSKPWTTSPRVKAMSVSDVKAIQAELVDAGYSVGSYGIDGSYGDSTGNAVKQLQTDLGLTADGVWGPNTQEALMTLKSDIAALRKEVADIPRLTMQIQVPLEGDNKGQSSNLTGIRKWYAHDIAKIVRLLGEIKNLLVAKKLTDAEVARIADAVAKKAPKG